jgi:hypothetical protein
MIDKMRSAGVVSVLMLVSGAIERKCATLIRLQVADPGAGYPRLADVSAWVQAYDSSCAPAQPQVCRPEQLDLISSIVILRGLKSQPVRFHAQAASRK